MKIENFNEPNSHEIVWLFAKDTSRSRMYMLAPDEFNLFRKGPPSHVVLPPSRGLRKRPMRSKSPSIRSRCGDVAMCDV